MFYCKYCGKGFERGYQIAAHTTMCKANPDSRPNKIERKYITLNKVCPKCGKEFSVEVRESSYLKGKINTKTYCSSSCANGHIISDNQKNKIKEKIKSHIEIRNCRCCKKEFTSVGYERYCSQECANKGLELKCEHCGKIFYNKKFRHYCSSECRRIALHDKLSEAGRKGINQQISIRRSNAEKMFCELCQNYFNKVTHNDPIFNGWDADVLIWDHKIAVLWNGKWHYEQITKNHSVEQVQNRDRIKCKEIENKGWRYYIIKDLGKFNEAFVKEEFEKFIKYIAG